MNIEKVCKNVGYDGQKYCCLKCGTTFEKESQARGHLSSCPSRKFGLGFSASLQASPAPPPAPHPAFTLPVADVVAPPSDYKRQIYAYQEQINDLNDRIARMENEYVHMVAQKNSGSSDKTVWIFVGASVLLILLVRGSSCDCDMPQKTRSRNIGRRGYGDVVPTLLVKGAGKLLDKSIERIFS